MIYFIQENEQGRDRIKIGYTSKDDVGGRLRELQTACPSALRVIAVMDGDMAKESYLHRLFVTSRISGEWFEASKQIKEFISFFAEPNISNSDNGELAGIGGSMLDKILLLIRNGARMEKNANEFYRLRWQAKNEDGSPVLNDSGNYVRKSMYVPIELVPAIEEQIGRD